MQARQDWAMRKESAARSASPKTSALVGRSIISLAPVGLGKQSSLPLLPWLLRLLLPWLPPWPFPRLTAHRLPPPLWDVSYGNTRWPWRADVYPAAVLQSDLNCSI